MPFTGKIFVSRVAPVPSDIVEIIAAAVCIIPAFFTTGCRILPFYFRRQSVSVCFLVDCDRPLTMLTWLNWSIKTQLINSDSKQLILNILRCVVQLKILIFFSRWLKRLTLTIIRFQIFPNAAFVAIFDRVVPADIIYRQVLPFEKRRI